MRAFPRPAGSLPPTSTSTTCGATTKGSKTGPRTRSIGLHYRRYEQLHDERSITYEPHEAVQANPATSEDESRVRQSDEPPLQKRNPRPISPPEWNRTERYPHELRAASAQLMRITFGAIPFGRGDGAGIPFLEGWLVALAYAALVFRGGRVRLDSFMRFIGD